MKRRAFIKQALAGVAIAGFTSRLPAAGAANPPRILLRSSWQTVNIGDIAHTPGVLHLLEKHIPHAEIRLWPSSVDNGVEKMLRARFPKLVIVQSKDEIAKAFVDCDFLLHGSGPSLVAAKDVARWVKETAKPFGVYGITLGTVDGAIVELLSKAKFAYFRDSVSLASAKQQKISAPVMDFTPDGAFAVDLRNDAAADEFLKANHLETGKFLCCIPRLRNTPYWKIKNAVFDQKKHDRNEAMKEHDHAPLRQAIIEVTKQAGMKVLLCPEDKSQMDIGKEMLLDKLPEDVKARVVWREKYWLTDEALSVYVKSAGLFGNEMHSPIMCIGNGVPAIVCRFAEQTSKGFMWRDIGLDSWLFDHDKDEDAAKIPPAVVAMAMDRKGALEKVEKAKETVLLKQKQSMDVLAACLK